MPLGEVDREWHGQVNGDDVVVLLVGGDLAVADRGNLGDVVDEPFGREESRCELEVVAGRPHRHRDAHRILLAAPHLDRHRFLGGEAVRPFEADTGRVRHEHTNRGCRAACRGSVRRWLFRLGGRPGGSRCHLGHVVESTEQVLAQDAGGPLRGTQQPAVMEGRAVSRVTPTPTPEAGGAGRRQS